MNFPNTFLNFSQGLEAYLSRFFDLSWDRRRQEAAEFRKLFLNVLERVGADAQFEQVRQQWARDSYTHANGFARLVLFVTHSGNFRLRVHRWSADAPAQPLNVHDHRYEFSSFVESGALEDVAWRPSEEGTDFRHFVYRPRDSSGGYTHTYTGQQTLQVASRRRFAAGDLYSVGHGELHYSAPDTKTDTVTFFAEDHRRRRPTANTYSTHVDVGEEHSITPSTSYSDYVSLLSRVTREACVRDSAYDRQI